MAGNGGNKEELVQANIDLKVNIESLKYDIKEKTELLAEASQAIDSLETRLSVMAEEREEERDQLQEKLRQLEEDFDGGAAALLADKEANYLPEDTFLGMRNTTTEGADDESLLIEVDAEMARGVVVPPKVSSAQQTVEGTPAGGQLGQLHGEVVEVCRPAAAVGPVASSSSTVVSQSLAVVEEKDEAMVSRLEDLEDNVDRLNAIIKETEVCLLQVSARVFDLKFHATNSDRTTYHRNL